jgi:HEAT repeat protein
MSAVPAGAELSWDGAMRLLEALPAMPLGERGAQVELLVHNASPGIRERVLRLGANLLPEERIAEHLRNDHDAVLRNAGLEMLKLRGARSFQLAVRLLADPEPDVVLQAVLLLDHLRDPRALEPLRAVLGHGDLNVAQAAILAIGRLGDGRSIPDLLPFLDADPWLQMAAVQALGDLRSRRAVADLARMLGDPVIGAIAAEALARIGGLTACRALAAHWLGQAGPLDDAALLGLLAHALEGLPRSRAALADRPAIDQLLGSLGGRLADPAPEIRAAAARCVLALGPNPGDEAALAALIALAEIGENGENGEDGEGAEGAEGVHAGQSVESGESGQGTQGRQGGQGGRGGRDRAAGRDAASPPPALRRRPDLIGALLLRPGTAGAWGLQLAALFPRRVAPAAILGALAAASGTARTPETLGAAVRCLARVPPAQAPPGLGPALLGLYLELPAELRPELTPVLRRFRTAVRGALAGQPETREIPEAPEAPGVRAVALADRVVLQALLGARPREVTSELLRLPLPGRLSAIVQLAGRRPVMRSLPWSSWLREAPEVYAGAAAEAAAASRLPELLPLLRAVPPRLAVPALVRAFAELADRDAVPWLLQVLRRPGESGDPEAPAATTPRPELRPLVLESLGRIGGAAARRALAAVALDRSPESRLAYRALAVCATVEDAPLFRAAITHPDWYVRLACAEVLGRFAGLGAAPPGTARNTPGSAVAAPPVANRDTPRLSVAAPPVASRDTPRLSEDLASLARLAADPVPAVAHRALYYLEG